MYKIHIRNQGAYVSPTTSSINNKLQVPSANWRTKKHVPYVIKEVSIGRLHVCQHHNYLFLIKPHRKLSKNPYVGLVMVMDASSLLPVNQHLANNYV